MAKIEAGVLELVLEQHRMEILRSLRARGYRLLPGQIMAFVPVENGVGVAIMVTTLEEQAAHTSSLLARDFFTKANLTRVLGWNVCVAGVLERLHRIVNGHRLTVGQLLEDPTFTVNALKVKHCWEDLHIEELQKFLKAYGHTLQP